MNFTQEQNDAIFTHDCNLIVTAGAGSGKTRVLVERFMAQLDAHPDWPLTAVVAITFTEKAAREMRDRVRIAIEARLREGAALDFWSEHQAALNSARIGTIHALCAQILRANPAEARLDPGFEVLDENEADIVLDDALDQTLARLVREQNQAAALLSAYDLRTVRGVLRRYALGGAALAVTHLQTDSAVIHGWQKAWEYALHEAMAGARLDAKLWEWLGWIHPDDLPPNDRLSEIWRLVHEQTPALLEGDLNAFVAAVRTLHTGISLQGGSPKAWGSKERHDECKAVLGAIRERLAAIREDLLAPSTELDEEAVRWLAHWRTAIRLAAETYDGMKKTRAALDFDDLEALTHRLLREQPGVAARYRDEFRHVLVDEFQDTNAAQRDIIYALTGADSPDGCGRLFVVGDPKQSIYAFRGADVSVFEQVRDHLCASGGRDLPLMTSFRTHGALVDAFNDLFSRILVRGSSRAAQYEIAFDRPMAAFRPAEPSVVPGQDCPLTIYAFPKLDKEHYPYFGADDTRRWEAWTLAQHIHQMVEDRTPVWARGLDHSDREKMASVVYVPPFAKAMGQGAYRPVDYGDVVILFQSMRQVTTYEEVFKAAGLPYVTIAGKGYFDRQEVWDLLYLLRALHNPADDLALATALRSPLFGLSDDALFALRLTQDAEGQTLPLWDALMAGSADFYFPAADEGARQFAREVLTELRDLTGRATIAELLTRALNLTGYLATLTGLVGGARRRGNVEKLVTLARESGRVSLGAFNAYARDLAARDVREGEAAIDVEGAVTLMSVHASKGLEFPVVVLANASWTRRRESEAFTLDPEVGPACKLPTDDPDDKRQSFAWTWACQLAEQRDRAERRRLLYVGATRAQDYLIISGALKCDEHAWLSQWLAALGLDPESLTPSPEPQLYTYAWGQCEVNVPGTPPDIVLARAAREGSGWDDPAVRAMQPFPGVDPVLPPLLAALPVDPHAPARILTATQIAALGRAPFYDPGSAGRAAFRNAVLHDAPEPVRPLPELQRSHHAQLDIIGTMVHRALQAWLLPGNTDPARLVSQLEAYAWESHLSDSAQLELAIQAALDLLRRFEASEVARKLEQARQVYRELPFVYRRSDLMIHGVLDVLYFDRHGKWHVLDYKTAPVPARYVRKNAQRYYLQIGVYAAAIQAKTGQTPEAHLYYIHPGTLLDVGPELWQAALARVEDDLLAALDTSQTE